MDYHIIKNTVYTLQPRNKFIGVSSVTRDVCKGCVAHYTCKKNLTCKDFKYATGNCSHETNKGMVWKKHSTMRRRTQKEFIKAMQLATASTTPMRQIYYCGFQYVLEGIYTEEYKRYTTDKTILAVQYHKELRSLELKYSVADSLYILFGIAGGTHIYYYNDCWIVHTIATDMCYVYKQHTV